jgi:hypothetical protein
MLTSVNALVEAKTLVTSFALNSSILKAFLMRTKTTHAVLFSSQKAGFVLPNKLGHKSND